MLKWPNIIKNKPNNLIIKSISPAYNNCYSTTFKCCYWVEIVIYARRTDNGHLGMRYGKSFEGDISIDSFQNDTLHIWVEFILILMKQFWKSSDTTTYNRI